MKKFLLMAGITFALAGCDDSQPASTAKEEPAEADAAKITAETAPAAVKPDFDVAPLLFASASRIKEKLGKPESEDKLTALQRKMDTPIDMVFIRDTTTLTVTYSPRTDKVQEFNISFPHATTDPMLLFHAGGLEDAGARYKTKLFPVLIDKSRYASVGITPVR